MMQLIRRSIEEALTKLSARPEHRTVSEAVVAAKIKELADRGYKPSDQLIAPLTDYLSGYGILLSGQPGTGKTFLMSLLKGRLRSVSEIMEYGIRGVRDWYSWTDGIEIVIDDLGAESVAAEYGAKDDLLKQVIAHRSEQQAGRTSITTNLTAKEIAARYGDRTLSRILGMCKAHTFSGASMRAPKQHEVTQ
jgi:DNA replication protein DnaC